MRACAVKGGALRVDYPAGEARPFDARSYAATPAATAYRCSAAPFVLMTSAYHAAESFGVRVPVA